MPDGTARNIWYITIRGEFRKASLKRLALTPRIQPPERHQIFNDGAVDLEFIAVCAPAWNKDNSVYLD